MLENDATTAAEFFSDTASMFAWEQQILVMAAVIAHRRHEQLGACWNPEGPTLVPILYTIETGGTLRAAAVAPCPVEPEKCDCIAHVLDGASIAGFAAFSADLVGRVLPTRHKLYPASWYARCRD